MHRYYAECKKRASLVPAAAVIPALRAYIKVVAFKTPVVEISIPPRPPPLGGPCLARAGWGAGWTGAARWGARTGAGGRASERVCGGRGGGGCGAGRVAREGGDGRSARGGGRLDAGGVVRAVGVCWRGEAWRDGCACAPVRATADTASARACAGALRVCPAAPPVPRALSCLRVCRLRLGALPVGLLAPLSLPRPLSLSLSLAVPLAALPARVLACLSLPPPAAPRRPACPCAGACRLTAGPAGTSARGRGASVRTVTIKKLECLKQVLLVRALAPAHCSME